MSKSKKPSKPQARMVWLGRRRGLESYEIGTRKSDWWPEHGFLETAITSFCQEQFHRVTRYRLEPGEVRRVRIVVEEVS